MSTMPTNDEIYEALNYIVEQPDVLELQQEVAALVRTRYGRFAGQHHPLNTLVEYARGKGGVEWLGPLWAIVDRAIGPAPAPQTETKPTAPPRRRTPEAKQEYNKRQNTYMSAKRARERQAIMLYRQVHSLPKPLIGPERLERLEQITSNWSQRKEDLLAGIHTARERNEMTADFWQEIENDLAAGLAGDKQAAKRVLGLD